MAPLRPTTPHAELHGLLSGGDALELHYQPLFSLPGRHVIGVEALARCRHPTRGLLPAREFIRAAEAGGTIDRLGTWALRTACEQLAAWDADGMPALTMAVNVSPRQLEADDLLAGVAAALRATGVAPERLALDLPEADVLRGDRDVEHRLDALHRLGVRLVVDGYTRGAAGIPGVARLPIGAVKLDRTTVASLVPGHADHASAVSTLSAARSFGVEVMAKGVEEEGQLRALSRLAFSTAQGFLLGGSLPADGILELAGRAPARRRAFLCDDSAVLRLLLREALEAQGFSVVGQAPDGRNLASLVQEARPDVLLLDLSMPEVDGLDALPSVRAAMPALTIVVVSGEDRDRVATQVLDRGADAFVEKRASLREICDSVRTAMEQRRSVAA